MLFREERKYTYQVTKSEVFETITGFLLNRSSYFTEQPKTSPFFLFAIFIFENIEKLNIKKFLRVKELDPTRDNIQSANSEDLNCVLLS